MRLIKRRSSASLSSQQQQQQIKSNASLVSLPTLSHDVPPVPLLDPSLASTKTSLSKDVVSPEKSNRRKRDSAEMKYPPTSFGQSSASGSGSGAGGSGTGSSGWTFGRMRSFKGKSRTSAKDNDDGAPKAASNSMPSASATATVIGAKGVSKGQRLSRESFRTDHPHPLPLPHLASKSAPSTPAPPVSPSRPVMQSPPPLPTSSPADFSRSDLATRSHAASATEVQPHTLDNPLAARVNNPLTSYTTSPHALDLERPRQQPQLQSARPPPRPVLLAALSSGSSAPSVGSEASTTPLVPADDDDRPHRRAGRASSMSPKKLTKRRPMTAIYDQFELVEQPSNPSHRNRETRHARSASAHASPSPQTHVITDIPIPYRPPVHSSSLPLPVGAAPPQHQTQFNWSLNRNPSSSTAASSGMTPSTEESAMIETPSNAVLVPGRGGSSGGLWEGMGSGAALSRASTFSSYREGDDRTIVHDPITTGKEAAIAEDNYDKRATIMPIQPGNPQDRPLSGKSSPTVSATLSTFTNTPTVSTSSDVTAKPPKSLRTSTSNLELRTPRPLSEAVISNDSAETTPSSARKEKVTFEVQPLAPEATAEHDMDTRHRPVRPAFGRLRSSSVGAMSVNTNSVYSVGEVMTATNATVATARAVQLTTSTTTTTVVSGAAEIIAGRAEREILGVTETIQNFESSSEAVRRAFDSERERGEWPLALTSDHLQYEDRPTLTSASPKSRSKRAHSGRAAPPPPHLSPKSTRQSQPPLSPILRPSVSASSPVKQVSFTTNVTRSFQGAKPRGSPIEAEDPKSPIRPGMPARSGSFSRLWRRLSSSGSLGRGKKSKSISYHLNGEDEGIPPVPQTKKHETYKDGTTPSGSRIKRSRASLDLTIPLKSAPISSFLDSFSSKENEPSRESSDERPSTPSSVRSKKGKKKPPAVPPPRANSAPLSGWTDDNIAPELPPITSLQNPLPSPDFVPFDFTASPLPVQGDLPSLSQRQQSEPANASLRSFRKLSAPPASSSWKTPLGPYTPPLSAIVSDYFRDVRPSSLSDLPEGIVFAREIQLHRVSLHEDAEMQSYDAKRKYRQSLVEIKDDEAFQATIEELVKLESDGRVRMTRAGGAALRSGLGAGSMTPPPIFRTASKDLLEKQVRQENIRAWFVTRELVQGERRHGRLLARGVEAVQTAAKTRDDLLPLPVLATSSEATLVVPKPVPAHYRSGSGNIRSSSRLRRPRTAGGNSERISGGTSSGNPSPSSPVPPLPSSQLTTTQTTPLGILALGLPKLQALSLTLSERFEHDPSPYGVADAFISMEDELTREISAWASQIGEVVVSDLGEELDRVLDQGRVGRRARRASEELGGIGSGDESDGDERLGFADIIIMPIQRAARYRLLFQELSTKLPAMSHTSLKIHRALEASIRLASECDKCQSFDLNALRRRDKKGKKARPVSMAPGMPLNGVW
ncbi:hypothetical protein I316_01025 [Kwoniella heveanensis BCC8398]|uniref:DH domain-containing protein n=1 Tax=Kwoniella heveanensis BCC8398 TaxID=1296120 RepID=A0A1B9H1J0_9TREE|nr:hypothetical protein I316_01025 [Kwoniella heveanensis BCC8398]